MTGVILFPATPGKGYKYKKAPKKVLDLKDDEALDFSRGNAETMEYFHYKPDLDKASDKDILKDAQEWLKTCDLVNVRKNGSGYTSGEKKWIIRILRCDREWFKRVRGQ